MRNIALTIVVTIVMAGLCEALIRVSNYDFKAMKQILYYQGADVPVHQVSKNPERLYELKPGSVLENVGPVHELETKYRVRSIRINALGFRGREQEAEKSPGKFRIVILGGSNTYGALVSDEESYPAQLERLLEERTPERYEVWNAGLSAYVMSQKVAYAEEIVDKFQPDLIIIEHYNEGRRPFLLGAPFEHFFESNRYLFRENVLFPFEVSTALQDLHFNLAEHSRLYRLIVLSVFRIRIEVPSIWGPGVFNAETHSTGRLREFLVRMRRDHPEIPAMIFIPLAKHSFENEYRRYINEEEDRSFVIFERPNAPEYSEVHPPSYVYRWYVEKLQEYLTEHELLPRD